MRKQQETESAEEMELKHEEYLDRQEQMRSSDLDWGIDPEDEDEDEYEPEDPLYAQLRREEKEDEKESDIWNEE